MAFHDLPAVGYVTDPATLAVQRGLPFGELDAVESIAAEVSRVIIALLLALSPDDRARAFAAVQAALEEHG